ncbi:hypothetical protein MKW92_015769 [Papaver armeniacum]|nr:hypothetical protein MKW92_033219 [Papaver armeniacum]KAI3944332.1 hypothetical protein MKW92_015769 [Papaver armeniacum]
MARFVNKCFEKIEETGFDKVLHGLAFVGSGIMVYFVVDEQNSLDTADKFLSEYSTFLPQVRLAREHTEEMVAFLKNNSTGVHTSKK